MIPSKHVNIPKPKVGVLLINLGTPEGTDYVSMWKYLREFLTDRRVIELPRLLWYPILYFIILIVRPKKSGKLYEKIWNKEVNISPLKYISKKMAEKIGKVFGKKKNQSGLCNELWLTIHQQCDEKYV